MSNILNNLYCPRSQKRSFPRVILGVCILQSKHTGFHHDWLPEPYLPFHCITYFLKADELGSYEFMLTWRKVKFCLRLESAFGGNLDSLKFEYWDSEHLVKEFIQTVSAVLLFLSHLLYRSSMRKMWKKERTCALPDAGHWSSTDGIGWGSSQSCKFWD